MSKIKLTTGKWYFNEHGEKVFIACTDPYEPDLFVGIGQPQDKYKSRFRRYFPDGRCYGNPGKCNLVLECEAPKEVAA